MKFVFATVAAALVFGLAGPGAAQADSGDNGVNVPAAANPAAWAQYVMSTDKQNATQDWSTPHGTLIADSGFRPFSDGFSFFNTGFPDRTNNAVFGSPLKTIDLNSTTLRNLMGKRVCLEGQTTGACTLTAAGKAWRDQINEEMAGGHCYGFATTAALLGPGQLVPSQFQAGAATPYDLKLAAPISREIARNMAQQYTTDIGQFNAKPSKIVETLRTALRPGALLPVLTIYSSVGGHAVTPYALYEGTEGKYDVAIYDNNYPDFRRVVRIDTTKEKAEYAFQVNPANPATDATLQAIGLVPTKTIASKQACPFCTNAKSTTIQIKPIVSDVPIRSKLTRLNGEPIKSLVIDKPTNPWEPGEPWSFPSYELPKKKSFLLKVNNKKSKRPIPLSVLATTGTYSLGTEKAKIPAGGVGKVGFDTKSGVVVYRGQTAGSGEVQFVDNGDKNVVSVSGRAKAKGDNTIGGRLLAKNKQVGLAPVSKRPGKVVAESTLEYFKNGKAHEVNANVTAVLPAGALLLIDYHRWNRNHPKKLKAYSVDGQKVIRVKVAYG